MKQKKLVSVSYLFWSLFIKFKFYFKAIDEEADELKRKEKQELLDEKLSKAKRRSLGNIRFIGELFKLGMLTEGIMHDCINRLLKQETDEENLECLCKLLTTIGKDIDKTQAAKLMKEHFEKLDKIIGRTRRPAANISSRIRFMILDVIELRHNIWVPRRTENAPKTIDEIHREIEEERRIQDQEIAYLNQQDNEKRRSQVGGRGGGTAGASSGGGRGGYHEQASVRNTASLDNSRQKMGTTIASVKKTTASGGQVVLGPQGPSFNKNPQLAAAPQQQQQSRSLYPPNIESNESRRGSMPGKSKQYSQQISHDKKLNQVKQMESTSQNSSRDSSLSRQSRDSSITRTNESTTVADNKQIVKKVYTEEEVERKVNNMVEEYMHNDDVNEALKDIEEFQPVNEEQFEEFVRLAASSILERSDKARKAVGKLFYTALKENKLDVKRFTAGFRMIFEAAEDMVIDIPRMGNYLGELLAPLIQEDFNVGFLKELCAATTDSKVLGDVLSEILHCASQRLGHSSVIKIFKYSNVNVNEILKDLPNSKEFLKEKVKVYFIIIFDRFLISFSF
jgi:translation initiation factor 4G